MLAFIQALPLLINAGIRTHSRGSKSYGICVLAGSYKLLFEEDALILRSPTRRRMRH